MTDASRRDFLTGRALRTAADPPALAADAPREPPVAGPTVRLGQRAMACEFDVILNPGPMTRLDAASEALNLVAELEDQLSVYRDDTELARINRTATDGPVVVEPRLFELMRQCRDLYDQTGGGFDPTSAPLIALWRRCRNENRIPTADELELARSRVGMPLVELDAAARTIRFLRRGMGWNLGSIGKGYALDRAGEVLDASGLESWLLHGGKSSILARGTHAGHDGWPIGVRNPMFPEKSLATLLLRDGGLGTSGDANQYYRLEGKRYGHILDPRTGWPVERMLSATVLAPTAALADALATAFFVIGVENARDYCHNHPEVSALLVPYPESGRRLQPVVLGIPDELLFWDQSV